MPDQTKSPEIVCVPIDAVRCLLDRGYLDDCCPYEEGWQSERMKESIAALRAIVGWPNGYEGNLDGYEAEMPRT